MRAELSKSHRADEEWLNYYNVNVMSVVRLCRHYLPRCVQLCNRVCVCARVSGCVHVCATLCVTLFVCVGVGVGVGVGGCLCVHDTVCLRV